MLRPNEIEKFFSAEKVIFEYMMQTQGDRALLAEYANKVPENGVIVEIGTCYGWSAVLLAMASLPSVHVWTIDFANTWSGKRIKTDDETGYRRHLDEVFSHADDGKITFLYGSSHIVDGVPLVEWPPWPKIDLLLVDGAHTYCGTMSDLIRWAPHVKCGGYVMCHDYGHHGLWKNVTPAVNHYFAIHQNEWQHRTSQSNLYVTQRANPHICWGDYIAIAEGRHPPINE